MLNSSVGCSLIKTIDLPWIEEGEEKKKTDYVILSSEKDVNSMDHLPAITMDNGQ